MNQLIIARKKFDKLEKEMQILEKKYKKLQEIRKEKGLPLNIYHCFDESALELVKIDKELTKKEEVQENILKEIKKMELENSLKNCSRQHNKFKDNKYLLKIGKEKREVYVNTKEEIDKYIKECMKEKRNLNVIEYIDFNKTLNKEVNFPVLKVIFELDFDKNYKVIQIPHQYNYGEYLKEVYELSSNKLLQMIEIGYDSNYEEIYSHLKSYNGEERMCFHNSFGSKNFIKIEKYNNIKFVSTTESHYKKVKVDVLDVKYTNLIKNLINTLEKCKEYTYDIEYIKNFIF